MLQDLRLALRLLSKDKAFALTSAATLALCIGAHTALFTVVERVLLRPLAVPDADRILLVYNSYPKAGVERAGAAAPDFDDRQRGMTVFEAQAMFNTRDPSLDVGGSPERIHVMQVTPSFFRVIQLGPQSGRAFTDEEGQLGKNRAIVLSEALRQRSFGAGNPIGHKVRVDGEAFDVVGVMPAGFTFIDAKVDAWVPLAFTDEQKKARYSNNWSYIGRLKADASIEQAQSQVDGITRANLERFPESRQIVETTGFHVVVARLQDSLVGDVRSTLYLLWGGALFVLLIGCVNVASLVLVRSRARLKELATRAALGAGRFRIVRQLVTEHLVLTFVSALVGLGVALGALRVFGALNLDELPRGPEIHIDAAIVLTTLLCAAAIGIALGAIPALTGLPANLSTVLREEGRGGTSGRGARVLRRLLVVTQVAIAFVLVIGSGLLLASFRHVLTIDPGFRADGVLTATVNLPPARYKDDESERQFAVRALQSVRALPGVAAAGTTSSIPFGTSFSEDVLLPEGFQLGPNGTLIAPYVSRVSAGYFETMAVRLLGGRFFDEHDTTTSPNVVIVDERLARRFWPGVNPVGRRMFEPGEDEKDITAVTAKTRWFEVIGVVGEVKLRGLVEGVGETGAYYLPSSQQPDRRFTFVARTSADPGTLASSLHAAIASIDRDLPVYDVQTMTARAARSLLTRRSSMVMALAFGFVALLLSAVGLYGVLAYLVTQRTKEIGIRLALGCSTPAVFSLVLREGLVLLGAGLALGMAGAAALSRTLEQELVGVEAGDPIVGVLAAGVLIVVALVACALPARRATRIDPVIALAE